MRGDRRDGWKFFLFLGWALIGWMPVWGHQIDTSYLTIVVRPDSLKLVVTIDEFDLLTRFDLDRNGDKILWREEMLDGVGTVFDYVEQHLALKADHQLLDLKRVKGEVQPDNQGNMFINLLFQTGLSEPPVELEIAVDFFERLGRDHKALVKILRPDKPLLQAVFTPDSPRQRLQVGEARSPLVDWIRRLFE